MDATKTLLIITVLLCGASGYFSYKTSTELQQLKSQVQVTEQKVDSLMTATAKIAKSTKTVSNKQPKGFWEALFSEMEEDQKAAAAEAKRVAAKQKVTVSSSYRLEDRYVSYKVYLPEYLGAQEGKVVVNITVNHSGDVTKTSVGSETTITDEEVIEASRKAALKTSFNYVSGADDNLQGTITYTFKKK